MSEIEDQLRIVEVYRGNNWIKCRMFELKNNEKFRMFESDTNEKVSFDELTEFIVDGLPFLNKENIWTVNIRI